MFQNCQHQQECCLLDVMNDVMISLNLSEDNAKKLARHLAEPRDKDILEYDEDLKVSFKMILSRAKEWLGSY